MEFIGAENLGLGNGLDNIASFGEKFSFVPDQYNEIVWGQIYRCIFGSDRSPRRGDLVRAFVILFK